MSAVDRRSINILLAVLDLQQRELADRLGYRAGYVNNVLNGFTPPSDEFKKAFGYVLADLLLGMSRTEVNRIPAAPLIAFLDHRARQAASKSEFYANLGLRAQGWNRRKYERSTSGMASSSARLSTSDDAGGLYERGIGGTQVPRPLSPRSRSRVGE